VQKFHDNILCTRGRKGWQYTQNAVRKQETRTEFFGLDISFEPIATKAGLIVDVQTMRVLNRGNNKTNSVV
jgi:hypothetical protein